MSDSGKRTVVVGTRDSALAMWQAKHIANLLQVRFPARQFAIKTVQTRGDVVQSLALSEIGTRGVFVKEIQDQLLAGEIDLGVHSLKDLPSEDLPGTVLAAVSAREDPRDALITRHRCRLADLPLGARIGTSSPRRAAQLRALRPDLAIDTIRGNVDTRVRKALNQESFDGVVLAAAGLRRLGLEDAISEYLAVDTVIPAPGQGIVGVEARAGDEEVLAMAAAIDDPSARLAAEAERAFVRAIGGGCYTPLGVHAVIRAGVAHLMGVLASPTGDKVVRDQMAGDPRDAAALGGALAARLLAAGGAELTTGHEHGGGR